MAAATCEDGIGDEEQLCQVLQAHARTLEQRELSQMRQGAVLQRKLDTAEQQLRELRQKRQVRREDAARRQQERQQAQTSETTRRSIQAARTLEAELNQRLEAAGQRAKELERSVEAAHSRHCQLEKDLSFWRSCGQQLLRRGQGGTPEAEGRATAAAASAEVAELRAKAVRLSAEAEALRQSCVDLSAQLPEVQRIADAARLQEAQLRSQNDALAETMAGIEAAAAKSREQAAAALRQEQVVHGETEALKARLDQERCAALQAAQQAGSSGEELAYLRKKLQERQQQVAALQLRGSQLQGMLQRHTGLECQHSDTGGGVSMSEGGSGGLCRPLDEPASWFAMLLFKSIFVRRAFCVHLALLYSWLFFLLWYMSSREHH